VKNQNIEKHLNFDQPLSAIAACLVKDDAVSVGLLPHRHGRLLLVSKVPSITDESNVCRDDKSQSL